MRRVAAGIAGALFSLCPAGLALAQGDLHVLKPTPGLEAGFGWSVSGAGDVDGDGHPDVVVGAPQAASFGPMAGLVMVFSGKHGDVLHSLPGSSARDNLGWSVSDAGDVNGDGIPDFVAGAPCGEPDMSLGYARVYSGDTGATLQKWQAKSLHDGFGISVSGAGDINGDGFADVLVGASMEDHNGLPDSGSVHVFSVQGGEIYRFDGHSAGGAFGSSVSDAGDVNNDGFPDIVVGAPMDEHADEPWASGSVEILSGKDGTSLYRFLDLVPDMSKTEALGCCVSDAGDVNADGYADVIVSGYRYMMFGATIATTAAAYVVSGKCGDVIAGSGELAGTGDDRRAVSGAGDIDGDGFSDVVMQLRTPDGVRAWSGKHGLWLFSEYGWYANDQLGEALSDAGDVNGDGIPEIVVGAPSKWTPYVRVISTRCGAIAAVGQGCAGSASEAPSMEITGCPVPGGSLSLVLDTRTPRPTVGLLIAGSGTASLPMGEGCTLLVAPPLTPAWLETDVSGVLIAQIDLNMAIPLAAVAVQAFIPDPASSVGFRNTSAVAIRIE